MNVFQFQLETKLIWGFDSLGRLPEEIKIYGRKAFIVMGNSAVGTGLTDRVMSLKKPDQCWEVFYTEPGEPTLSSVERCLERGRSFRPESVIAIGGGSVMDTAKAIAGMIPNSGNIKDYFYARRELSVPPLPVITVPTIFGTGAEVSFNAVLTDPETKIKQSFRNPGLRPRVTIVDPGMARTVPGEYMIYTALDGLTQSIEAFVSKNASCISDIFARDAARRFVNALTFLSENNLNDKVLEDLAYGSMIGGIALAAARLGAVHGMAHPIGAIYDQPHGKVCAALLPAVMKYNLPVVTEKYALLAKDLGLFAEGDEIDEAVSLIKKVWEIDKRLGIPTRWRNLGVKKEDFPLLIERSMPSGSLKANPRTVQKEDLFKLFEENF